MKLLSIIVFSVLFWSGSSRAEGYDNQGRLLPTDQGEFTTCKFLKGLLKPDTKAYFYRHSVHNLTKKLWSLRVCASCSAKTSAQISKWAKADPSGEATPYPETLLEAPGMLESADQIKYLKLLNKAGCPPAKSLSVAVLDLSSDVACTQKAFIEMYFDKLGFGSYSMHELMKVEDSEFIDFYQVCHRELNKSAIVHAKDNAIHLATLGLRALSHVTPFSGLRSTSTATEKTWVRIARPRSVIALTKAGPPRTAIDFGSESINSDVTFVE